MYDDPYKESDPPHVEPSASSCTTIVVASLEFFLPSIYYEQYWDAEDLL